MNERYRDDLEQARAKWWATVSTGDLDGYLDLFADDAVWVTPELDEIAGRDAIRSWLEPVFAQFDYELTITVADVRIAGELGIERARFLSRMTPKMPPFRPRLVGDPAASEEADQQAPSAAMPTVTDADAVSWGESDDPHPAAQVHAAPDLVAADDRWEDDETGEDDHEALERPGDTTGPVGLVSVPTGTDDDDPDVAAPRSVVDGDQVDHDDDHGHGVQLEQDDLGDHDAEDERGLDADVGAPLQAAGLDPGDDEPHEGRYLMYWRWHGDRGWLVERYADVTGVG